MDLPERGYGVLNELEGLLGEDDVEGVGREGKFGRISSSLRRGLKDQIERRLRGPPEVTEAAFRW